MKRLAILLAVILALSIFASAAETTTAEVPVTLTVIESQRQISVTVPAALPVSVEYSLAASAKSSSPALIWNEAPENSVRAPKLFSILSTRRIIERFPYDLRGVIASTCVYSKRAAVACSP